MKRQGSSGLASGILLVGSGLLLGAPALAQTAAPYLEYSSVIGVGGTISIIRLPIKLSDGSTVYKDVTVKLSVDDMGGVKTLSKTTAVTSPALNTSNIVAGNYLEAGSSGKLMIAGPGPLDDGGEAKWTIVPIVNSPCGAPATFYTGPIQQNPLYTRLQAAGITSDEYSYGIVDADASCGGGDYSTGHLIGVAQDGARLEIVSFTDSKDRSLPVARDLYKMVP